MARLAVTIDTHGSMFALDGATEVLFDASGSTGTDLRYAIDFGEGFVPVASQSRHVLTRELPARAEVGERTITVRVTDAAGRTDTASQRLEIVGIGLSPAYYWSAFPPESWGLLFQGGQGKHLEGRYSTGSTAGRFTLTVDGSNDVHVTCEDGWTMDGTLTLRDDRAGVAVAPDRHLLLRVRGGPGDGKTLDFRLHDSY